MLTLEDLREYSLPQEFIDTLPTECPDCGAEIVLTESLTGLSCVNPTCGGKVAARIDAICKATGIKEFGESRILQCIDSYDVVNPMEIFGLQFGMPLFTGASEKLSDKIIEQIQRVRDAPRELWEYVQLVQVPRIQTSARPLFEGYESLGDFFDDLEDGGIDWVANRLGIQTDRGVRAHYVFSTLLEYRSDIESAVDLFNIVTPDLDIPELLVVCSDQVGSGFSTKNEFYETVKTRSEGKYRVTFASSVKKSIDVLVWGGADGSPARYTSKVSKVETWNESGSEIPILTAVQFLERYNLA